MIVSWGTALSPQRGRIFNFPFLRNRRQSVLAVLPSQQNNKQFPFLLKSGRVRAKAFFFFLTRNKTLAIWCLSVKKKNGEKINKQKCWTNGLMPCCRCIFQEHSCVFLGVNMCYLKTCFSPSDTHTHSHSRPPASFLANIHKSVIRNEAIAWVDPVWINSNA